MGEGREVRDLEGIPGSRRGTNGSSNRRTIDEVERRERAKIGWKTEKRGSGITSGRRREKFENGTECRGGGEKEKKYAPTKAKGKEPIDMS